MLERLWHRDALGLFDNVVETSYDLGSIGTNPVAAANPDRVVCYFACFSTYVTVSTKRAPPQGQGLGFGNATLPLVLTWDNDGPLVQAAWFAPVTIGVSITVIEVILTRNPNDYGYPGAYLERSLGYMARQRSNGNGKPKRPLSAVDSETVRRLLEKYKP